MWTCIFFENGEKNLHFKKYLDTCGQGLKDFDFHDRDTVKQSTLGQEWFYSKDIQMPWVQLHQNLVQTQLKDDLRGVWALLAKIPQWAELLKMKGSAGA